ncbi:hypothetical protein KY335_01855 [Candidatus Woesearchaeota archaeon]|nr:hypothetical protein [Candidatus Woesearchaeota archaeon]
MKITQILFFVLVVSILALATGCSNAADLTELSGATTVDTAQETEGPVVQVIDDTEPVEEEIEELPEEEETEEDMDSIVVESISDKFESEPVAVVKPKSDNYGGDGAIDVFFVSTNGEENKISFIITQIEISSLRGDKELLFKGRQEITIAPGSRIRVAKKLIDPGSYVMLKVYTDAEEGAVITFPDGEEYAADFSFNFEKQMDRQLESGETLAVAFDMDVDRVVEEKSRVSQTNDYALSMNGLQRYVEMLDNIHPDFETGAMTDSEFEQIGFVLGYQEFSVALPTYR